MKHLFYCPALVGSMVDLQEDEAHHARAVLRLSVGTRIGLLDGRGNVAEAEIVLSDKRRVGVSIISQRAVHAERPARIHLAVAPTKQMDRFEWMLEKCTEIGVDRITPLITERTERTKLRRDRLERVLIGAMKQSQRAWLPQLDEQTTINELIDRGIPAQRWFGWCEGDRTSLAMGYRAKEDAILFIGPEGDFTPDEAGRLVAHGFSPVGLGEARLRTETAAVAACAYMNMAQQV